MVPTERGRGESGRPLPRSQAGDGSQSAPAPAVTSSSRLRLSITSQWRPLPSSRPLTDCPRAISGVEVVGGGGADAGKRGSAETEPGVFRMKIH